MNETMRIAFLTVQLQILKALETKPELVTDDLKQAIQEIEQELETLTAAKDDMPLDMSISAAVDHEIARESQDGQNVIVHPSEDER